ncbi:MAG: multiheme c-type cytochrome, partial [Candidatus Aminicenantales bacterium]
MILSILASLVLAGALFASNDASKWAGSRISPVHQIPLKDEYNQLIVPTETSPLPFSTRFSCAPCHDYDVIKGGWHFNAAADVPPGRPGEPWILLDERTGMQIPLSYRPWKGMWNPAALGLSNWDFTLLFGRHFPGGSVADPADSAMTPDSRWSVSGKIEINCLGCHNASRIQNPSEWAKQVLRENFRWAATAAAGLGEVGGMSSRLRPTWDLFDGPNPDDSEWAVAPSVKYNKTLFDSKHKAFLDINYKPDDARCLACHSSAPAGQAKRDFDDDVHTAAGIKCAECHRNDVSHNMIRGYEGEGRINPAAAGEDFTCRGCHLGGETADGRTIVPGRMGAPRPVHKGLPEIHFQRLNCTVCHSGPLPAGET